MKEVKKEPIQPIEIEVEPKLESDGNANPKAVAKGQ